MTGLAKSPGFHLPGVVWATIPDTLPTTFFRRATSAMPFCHFDRSLAYTGPLPQWSSMKRVPGHSSISFAPSSSSSARMHRSKLYAHGRRAGGGRVRSFLSRQKPGRCTVAVQHLADALDEVEVTEWFEVLGEIVRRGSSRDDGGDGRRIETTAHREDILGLSRLLLDGHVHFHVNSLDDVQSRRRLQVVAGDMALGQRRVFP